MSQLTIAVKLNERQLIFVAQWPSKATVKAMARLKLARLKRKIDKVVFMAAMAIIPMPQVAAA